jgi:hypothetical protein
VLYFADLMLVFPTVTVLFVCSVVAYHDAACSHLM